MNVRSKVKTNARRAMTQNYVQSLSIMVILVCVCFLFAVFALVANTLGELFKAQLSTLFNDVDIFKNWNYLFSPAIVGASLLLELMLFAPLALGTARWFYRLAGGAAGETLDLFDYFSGAKKYFGSLWLELNLFVRRFLYSLLFMAVPCAILCFGLFMLAGNINGLPLAAASVLGTMLFIAGTVLLLVTAVFTWVFLKRYALARYLYTEEDGARKPRRAVKQSIYIMKGHKSELFLFDVSFLGWFALCVFVIPLFYVGPYYCSAVALYARVLIEGSQHENIPAQTSPTREFGSGGEDMPPQAAS